MLAVKKHALQQTNCAHDSDNVKIMNYLQYDNQSLPDCLSACLSFGLHRFNA